MWCWWWCKGFSLITWEASWVKMASNLKDECLWGAAVARLLHDNLPPEGLQSIRCFLLLSTFRKDPDSKDSEQTRTITRTWRWLATARVVPLAWWYCLRWVRTMNWNQDLVLESVFYFMCVFWFILSCDVLWTLLPVFSFLCDCPNVFHLRLVPWCI